MLAMQAPCPAPVARGGRQRTLSASATSDAVPGPIPTATMTLLESALMLLRALPMPVMMGMSTACKPHGPWVVMTGSAVMA